MANIVLKRLFKPIHEQKEKLLLTTFSVQRFSAFMEVFPVTKLVTVLCLLDPGTDCFDAELDLEKTACYLKINQSATNLKI